MWYSVRVIRSLCAVFFAVVAVAFFSPGVAWAVPTWLLLLSGLAGFVIWRQRYTNS